jgi:hypothetical protein
MHLSILGAQQDAHQIQRPYFSDTPGSLSSRENNSKKKKLRKKKKLHT